MENAMSNTAECIEMTNLKLADQEIKYPGSHEELNQSGTGKQIGAFSDRLSLENVRNASRALWRRAKEGEYEKRLKERNALVLKDVRKGLNRSEKARLSMLRWEIECIEDARIGGHLDGLEEVVSLQNQMAAQVASFVSEAKRVSKTRQRRNR